MLEIQSQFGNYPKLKPELLKISNSESDRLHTEKYQVVSIRLHPQAIAWAKAEAKKQGVDYQTIINEALLKLSV